MCALLKLHVVGALVPQDVEELGDPVGEAQECTSNTYVYCIYIYILIVYIHIYIYIYIYIHMGMLYMGDSTLFATPAPLER